MKKIILILMAMFAFNVADCSAQNLLDFLKKGAEKAQNDSTGKSSSILGGISDLVTGILGNSNVNSQSLVGTWNYVQPAVVLESENMLSNAASMAAGKTAEQKLQSYLNKLGFTEGKVKITFNEDGKGTITYGTKNIPFQWSVEGSDLTINLAGSTISRFTSSSKLNKYTSFKVNCKLGINNLQLSFKADKLAEFITKIVSSVGKSTNSSTMNTVVTLLGQIDGMYLGLTLKK